MKVKLIFDQYTVEKIVNSYLKLGAPKPAGWNGPEFEDVEAVHYDAQFYSVQVKGAIYRYPVNSIERVKEFE